MGVVPVRGGGPDRLVLKKPARARPSLTAHSLTTPLVIFPTSSPTVYRPAEISRVAASVVLWEPINEVTMPSHSRESPSPALTLPLRILLLCDGEISGGRGGASDMKHGGAK